MRASSTVRGLVQLTLGVLALALPCQGARPRERDDAGAWTTDGVPTSPRDSVSAPWLSPDWAYRVQVAVPPDSIASTDSLRDFTLYLPLEGDLLPGVFAHGKPDGSDLVVTQGDGVSLLPREVVTYDAVGRSAELWFRADTLSAAANVFYLYYGNPDTSIALTDGEAWDERYLGVYHFDDDPGGGLLTDHGRHGHDATPRNGWTSSDTTAGVIGQAWRFDGTHHWIDGDALTSADSSVTISAWLAISDLLTLQADFALQSETGYWHLSASRNDQQPYPDIATQQGFIVWDCNPAPDDRLHHFAWVMDGVQDTTRFWFDGAEPPVWFRYAPNAPHKVYTGVAIGGNVGIMSPSWGNVEDLFCGILDEYHAYQGTRGPGWVLTEYRNQRHGSAFYTFSEEEGSGVPEPNPGLPVIAALRAFPNPAAPGAAIRFRLDAAARGQLVILDPAGRRVSAFPFSATDNGAVREIWEGRGTGDVPLPGGIYLIRAVSGDRVRQGRVVLLR